MIGFSFLFIQRQVSPFPNSVSWEQSLRRCAQLFASTLPPKVPKPTLAFVPDNGQASSSTKPLWALPFPSMESPPCHSWLKPRQNRLSLKLSQSLCVYMRQNETAFHRKVLPSFMDSSLKSWNQLFSHVYLQPPAFPPLFRKRLKH